MRYPHPNREITLIKKGLIDFKEAWEFQEALFQNIQAIKMANRGSEIQKSTPNYLIVCQHPLVYTLGKSGKDSNLLLPEDTLQEMGATFFRINRGGDITHHGPGQLVVYPILDLENFFTDIHLYLRKLEESVIKTLTSWGIHGSRFPGLTGVWLDPDGPGARKICAMGVKCGRWITMHGLALNVNNDLNYFSHIVPCGISDKKVTSMKAELGLADVNIDQVAEGLIENLMKELDATLTLPEGEI